MVRDRGGENRQASASQQVHRAPCGWHLPGGSLVRTWVDRPPRPLMAPPSSPQEIDGKALLLLRSDTMMKYMGLKLGPALKLCYHIDRLKQGKF